MFSNDYVAQTASEVNGKVGIVTCISKEQDAKGRREALLVSSAAEPLIIGRLLAARPFSSLVIIVTLFL